MSAMGIVLSIVLVAMNLATTVWLAKADVLSSNQKWAQGAIVWLLPGIGAAVIAGFLLSSRERPNRKSHHVPNESDWPGINL